MTETISAIVWAAGRNWSVSLEIRDKRRLVTDGLYRYVRHPMYASFWMWAIAQALLIPNRWPGLPGWSASPAFVSRASARRKRGAALVWSSDSSPTAPAQLDSASTTAFLELLARTARAWIIAAALQAADQGQHRCGRQKRRGKDC